MKRILAMLLAALLLCAGAAQAQEWPEGTSPSQPYENVPEMDLTKQLGYMMFYPSESLQAEHACQRLYIYLPREDVRLGDGTLMLYTADGTEVWRTEMSNTDAITLRELTESELIGLLWGSGKCVEIRLPRTLKLGTSYFVNLKHGAIVTESGLESNQIGGRDAWSFTVDGDYGVSNMEYRRPKANGKYDDQQLVPQPGDEIRFDLALGGDVVMASVYGKSVDFLVTTFTDSCEVTGQVTAEAPVWGVLFLDAQGNVVNKVEFQ